MKNKMKIIVLISLCLIIELIFFGCAHHEQKAPKKIFFEITEKYGNLPAGSYFDSEALEWEESFLTTSFKESIFYSEKNYNEWVEEGYFYLSSSLNLYEEIMIIRCYTSEQAMKVGGVFFKRAEFLKELEEDDIEEYIYFQGRYVIYCRLSKIKVIQEAIEIVMR